jgi:hypothetical protein
LTLQYDTALYLLEDTPAGQRVIGKYINVYEYTDGRIEARANGTALPYPIYDRLSEVKQGAIVENKRLGHALEPAQLVKEQRDSRRSGSVPACTNRGNAPTPKKAAPGKKAQCLLDAKDNAQAIDQVASTQNARKPCLNYHSAIAAAFLKRFNRFNS